MAVLPMAALSVKPHCIADSSFRDSEKPICSCPILKVSSVFASSNSFCILRKGRLSSSRTTIVTPRATPITNEENESPGGTDTVPTPDFLIDLESDPDATVVEIMFGDCLAAFLDTMNALRNLGLNVVKANVYLDSSGKRSRFSITKVYTGTKVEEPGLLEAIRFAIIHNMSHYRPESTILREIGPNFGSFPPNDQVEVYVDTHVRVSGDGPNRSLLSVKTTDRHGLLVDLVKLVAEAKVTVESGEFHTEAKFHLSYRGKALPETSERGLFYTLYYNLTRDTY